MVTTLALMDIFEDCLALLRLYAALENTSDTAPHKFSIDDGVCCCPALHLPGGDLISRQFFVHQKFEDWLSPGWCCYFFACHNYNLYEGGWAGRRRVGVGCRLLSR